VDALASKTCHYGIHTTTVTHPSLILEHLVDGQSPQSNSIEDLLAFVELQLMQASTKE
jgi:hypothetical protein